MKQDAFIVAYMRRHHPWVRYELRELPTGWQLRVWRPPSSVVTSLYIREQRVFPGAEARAAREIANSINTLLAPDESWRLHADYV